MYHADFPRLEEVAAEFFCRLADGYNAERAEYVSLDGEPICEGSLETGLFVGYRMSIAA